MRFICFISLALGLATPALAHHPLDGLPMTSFTHGIFSGVGHPILGFDHLFFVVLVGIASILVRAQMISPLAYIAAMLGGCLVSSLWTATLASELMIALSLLVLGSMLLSGRRYGKAAIMLSFAGFGLFHGAAFGLALSSQEAAFGIPVLLGYLLGLGITQYAIAIVVGWVFIAFFKTTQPAAIQARLAGAMVAGAGLYLTLEQLQKPILGLISS